MYQSLIVFHSLVRWLVLLSLVYSIYRACRGYYQNLGFSKVDNYSRHWTATIAHVQLLIGILLYTQSPVTREFWKNINIAISNFNAAFFGFIHIILMLAAIVLLTIGSAKAKRKSTDKEKFKTVLVWFSVAFVIIFIAIPWPFSPLANRPYLR